MEVGLCVIVSFWAWLFVVVDVCCVGVVVSGVIVSVCCVSVVVLLSGVV